MKDPKISIRTFFLIVVVSLTAPISLSAINFPYDYVFYPDEGGAVPIPRTYETKRIIGYLGTEHGEIGAAKDLFIDDNDILYVADTNNNRIIKMTSEGKVLGIFTGDERGFNNPEGVYVDSYGDIFVADTENSRIIHLSKNGELVEEMGTPESSILGEFFSYYPSKISLSPTGFLYVIKGKSIMILDAHNRFRGYLGQAEIGFDFNDWLIGIVATEDQRERIRNRTAPPFTNMYVDEDGMIYATSYDVIGGQLKKLNATGENIYKEQFYGDVERGDTGGMILPTFADIVVSDQGIVSSLEEEQSKIYQYDQEGTLLAVFGGTGTMAGRFVQPTSIALDSNRRIFILDAGSIQILEPTYFISTVHDAIEQYSEGHYDRALELWREVQRMDENYRLAASGIARALHKQGEWGDALAQYRSAQDAAGYSRTFKELRHELFRENFALVVLVAAVAVFLIARTIIAYRVLSVRILDAPPSIGKKLLGHDLMRLAPAILVRPGEAFRRIRAYRGRFSYIPVFVILLSAIVIRVAYIYLTHFPLAAIAPRDANILLESVKMFAPLLTWVVACYAVTSILDGEAELKEVLIASVYALVPYIVFALPLAGLSRILSSVAEEQDLFVFLNQLLFVWTVVLLLVGVRNLHDYRMVKATISAILSVFGMALIWALLVLMFALSENLRTFVQGLIIEMFMTLRFR